MTRILQIVFLPAFLAATVGCDPSSTVLPAKKPRPVAVRTLHRAPPPAASMVSASAGSWKTEEIGFEVSGRVEWVAEPNTFIEGRVVDSDGNMVVEGTPIAGIESERYQLQVDSANADLSRAQQNVAAGLIELERSLPSQLKAAQAEKKLAELELSRTKQLRQQNAGSQSDVDRADANYQTAVSKVEQIEANQKAKTAEIESLRFQVKHAEQSLRDAQRSLEDCTLYSSFRGQVADVAVVPGSVVSAGSAVATVQMMDPIKIEVEVSAADSQRLRKRQRLPLLVTMPDGTEETHDGFLYLVDPVADPQTRTFTLTLLMLNRRSIVDSAADRDANIATTDQGWAVNFSFLPGAEEGMAFAIEEAIHQDESGDFVWKIDNFRSNESLPEDRLAKVSKARVEVGALKLPFLGNWLFRQITFLEDGFDPEFDMIAGKLSGIEGSPSDWNGDTVLIDRSSQWMLRPGDVVKVDLSNGSIDPGFYVPMDAISYSEGKTYLFVVDEGSVVKRIEVSVESDAKSSTISSLLRVEAVDSSLALEGKQFVTRGVHYLVENEPVKVVADSVGGIGVSP